MNNKQIISLVVGVITGLVIGYFIGSGNGSIKSENQVSLNSMNDSLNYFLGINWGYSLEQAPWEVDGEMIASGMLQVTTDSSAFDPMVAQAVFRQLQMGLQAAEQEAAQAKADVNGQEGIAFLADNQNKEGVFTTESGLQYEVIEEGDGPKPTAESKVSVLYEGTLLDGTVFDGNFETQDTISFSLQGVIPGWTEGVQLMNVGSTYRFFIPSELAYGPRGSGPIPANSTLIFKIKLLGIE